MARLTLTLATWIVLSAVASASLTPRLKRYAFDRADHRPLSAKASGEVLQRISGPGNRSDFVLTDQTEVLLNGKPCRFNEVPAHATIVGMEVAADRKTVLKVRFRTGK